jgi:hypothetical protein
MTFWDRRSPAGRIWGRSRWSEVRRRILLGKNRTDEAAPIAVWNMQIEMGKHQMQVFRPQISQINTDFCLPDFYRNLCKSVAKKLIFDGLVSFLHCKY